mmetsp:Transcript_46572/g.120176  ORF Transcript_46572/g.120176 Transcript_46572/m.120176 type:complete len:85 (-) Transcript_46572:74-328(-)
MDSGLTNSLLADSGKGCVVSHTRSTVSSPPVTTALPSSTLHSAKDPGGCAYQASLNVGVGIALRRHESHTQSWSVSGKRGVLVR